MSWKERINKVVAELEILDPPEKFTFHTPSYKDYNVVSKVEDDNDKSIRSLVSTCNEVEDADEALQLLQLCDGPEAERLIGVGVLVFEGAKDPVAAYDSMQTAIAEAKAADVDDVSGVEIEREREDVRPT